MLRLVHHEQQTAHASLPHAPAASTETQTGQRMAEETLQNRMHSKP